MVRKEKVFFKMLKEVRVKNRFENFSYSRRKSNRSVVGGIRAVTLLRHRLYKCMLPGRRVGSSFEYEAKKTTKHRGQFIGKLLQL